MVRSGRTENERVEEKLRDEQYFCCTETVIISFLCVHNVPPEWNQGHTESACECPRDERNRVTNTHLEGGKKKLRGQSKRPCQCHKNDLFGKSVQNQYATVFSKSFPGFFSFLCNA